MLDSGCSIIAAVRNRNAAGGPAAVLLLAPLSVPILAGRVAICLTTNCDMQDVESCRHADKLQAELMVLRAARAAGRRLEQCS